MLNPNVDSSNFQVLYTNKLLPLEENVKKIVVHYDKFGFGNGFELSKPSQMGKFSSPVDLFQGHKNETQLIKRMKQKNSIIKQIKNNERNFNK